MNANVIFCGDFPSTFPTVLIPPDHFKAARAAAQNPMLQQLRQLPREHRWLLYFALQHQYAPHITGRMHRRHPFKWILWYCSATTSSCLFARDAHCADRVLSVADHISRLAVGGLQPRVMFGVRRSTWDILSSQARKKPNATNILVHPQNAIINSICSNRMPRHFNGICSQQKSTIESLREPLPPL